MVPVLQMFAVIIAAVILPAPTTAICTLELNYAVTVSSQLKGGNKEKLCAQIQKPSEPIYITIALEMPTAVTKTIVTKKLVEHKYFNCFDFMVPEVRSGTVANISVLIESQDKAVVPIAKKSKVLIDPPGVIHVVHTDKPIYLQGEIVPFRILSLDTNYIPVRQVYTEVAVKDPNGNCIAQWLNKQVDGGIIDLSHQLISEAVEGIYRINANTNQGEKITHTFEVKEFVLPKYEVQVLAPSVVTVFDEEAIIKICGKYTYGKPVIGSVQTVVCAKGYLERYSWHLRKNINNCNSFMMSTDKSGCATQVVNIAESFTSTNIITHFEVSVELKEFDTGVTLNENRQIEVKNKIRIVSFERADPTYKYGLPFEAKIKLIGPDNSPVPNEDVTVYAPNFSAMKVMTDSRGMAKISLKTTGWKGSVPIRIRPTSLTQSYPHVPKKMRPRYISGNHRVMEFYSESKNFVKLMSADEEIPCNEDITFDFQYIIQGNGVEKGQDSFDFYYMVFSKGVMRHYGQVAASVKHGVVNTGNLPVKVIHTVDLAPIAQVTVFAVLLSGEMMSDSMDYPVQLCFSNSVSLKFSQPQQLPAQKTKLHLKAAPGSLCSVRAIDLGVLLQEQQQALTPAYMNRQLPLQKLSGYNSAVEDDEPYPCLPDGKLPVSLSAYGLSYLPQYYERDDTYSSFKEIGIKIVTNMKTKKPRECKVVYSNMLTSSPLTTTFPTTTSSFPGTFTTSGILAKKGIVSRASPETWIWDLVTVGDDGLTNLEKTVPDTITKWVASALCVSPVGFGMSPSVEMTTFKPFFVSLSLPYSVIQGESFSLGVMAYNYLNKCIAVKTTLADSDQYTFKNCPDCQYNVCLCGKESKTFSWLVTPDALGQVNFEVSAEALKDTSLCGSKASTIPKVGRVDKVVKQLLVELEGIPQSISHNALICPSENSEEKFSLVLPKDFVEGSAKASISVVGDFMGQALKNIDNLLKMPFPGVEQNMLRFTSNIIVLDYLKNSKQLTTEVLNRGKDSLTAGYQRQLLYKHNDGSYSTFGNKDGSGNIWLTAFVMKAFSWAQSIIYVENKQIDQAKRWLSLQQGPDGCFRSVGNNPMEGGVMDEVTLTGYVITAMLETDSDVTDAVVQNGRTCLKTALEGKIDNTYTLSLMLYTFTLTKDEETRSKLVEKLHLKSTTEGGTRHWVRAGASMSGPDSLEVETASYVLSSLLSGPTLQGFGHSYSAAIARWLVKQQNPYGGFFSTQDTVVALQALSKYAAANQESGKTTVTVTSKGAKDLEFVVDEKNKLLLQEESLSNIPGEYTVKATGERCVLTQISMTYNTPAPAVSSGISFAASSVVSSNFEIIVGSIADCNLTTPNITLSVSVRYQGPRAQTNIVLLNIKLLSGYTLNQSSLDQLMGSKTVKRVRVTKGIVSLYLAKFKREETEHFSLQMNEQQTVSNPRPAWIRVFDYYQPCENGSTTHTSPCAN